MHNSNIQYDKIAEQLLSLFPKSEVEDLLFNEDLTKYQSNPVGFIEKYYGYILPDKIKEICESVRDNRVTIAQSCNGFGKCVEENEGIQLADGRVVKAKDLIGKYFGLLTFDKEQTPKLSYAFDNGMRKVYKIRTQFGREIIRTGNHPLYSCKLLKSPSTGNLVKLQDIKWRAIDDLKVGNAVAVTTKLNVKTSKRIDEDHVKLMGYLIGDGGTTTTVAFAQKDSPQKREFIEIVERLGGRINYIDDINLTVAGKFGNRFEEGSNPILNLSREWGFHGKKAKHKRFPKIVWELENDQLALFINRYFSCDGWAYNGKKRHANEIGITSASEGLIRDIELAMIRLGIEGYVNDRDIKFNGKIFHAWQWTTRRSNEIVKFVDRIGCFGKEEAFLKCKEEALKRDDERRKPKWPYKQIDDGYKWERIKSIEYIGEKRTVGISVEDTHTYLTTFVEHNTFVAAVLSIWAYKCFPQSNILLFAAPPLRNLTENLLGNIRSNIRVNKKLFSKDKVTSLKITDSDSKDNSSENEDFSMHSIIGITIPTAGSDEQKQASVSGYHAPYQLFIFDEADGIPDPIFVSTDGCLSSSNQHMLALFNPKKRSGEIYQKIRNNKAKVIRLSAFDHPNVVSGKELIPGAVTREVVLRRINEQTRALAPGEEPTPESCFEVPKFLVGQTTENDGGVEYPKMQPGSRKIENQIFWWQTLGEYPQQSEDQLISTEWIDRAFSNYQLYVAKYGDKPPEGIRPINGMDVSDLGGDFNTICSRYGSFIPPIRSWKGIDIGMSAHKAAEIHAELHAIVTNVESDGLGAACGPILGRQYYYRCEICGFVSMEYIENCHTCNVNLKKYHCSAKKVYVGSAPTKKCEFGEFDLLRSQLAWAVREFLRTNENAMIAPDDDLKEEMEAIGYEVGKTVSITKKKTLRKMLGRSPDKFDALMQCFYESPVPKIRMI